MFGLFGSILPPSELPALMAKDHPQSRSCPTITLITMNALDVRIMPGLRGLCASCMTQANIDMAALRISLAPATEG